MKKTVALLAVGLLVGYCVATNSSDIKRMLDKGKRKIKDMLD